MDIDDIAPDALGGRERPGVGEQTIPKCPNGLFTLRKALWKIKKAYLELKRLCSSTDRCSFLLPRYHRHWASSFPWSNMRPLP